MKKFLSIACILTCALMLFACVNKSEDPSITVYVTLSNSGTAVMKQEKIKVVDLNNDSKYNVDEVLVAAHKAQNKESDYASAVGQYGLGITKLLGDTSGCYGYFVNNASCNSLADEVTDGAYVTAYVYVDKEYWSDSYCYFDKHSAEVNTGAELSLTLKNSGYDENWNTVFSETANAYVTIDGTKTSYVTDANGIVTLTFDKAGTYYVSAVSDTITLVPTYCVVTVK